MENIEFTVASINISEKKGTVKVPRNKVTIDEKGIINDAHAGNWHRQVSLLGQESVDQFIEFSGQEIKPGEFAENITTRGLDLTKTGILDRFKIGEVELEVTQIGKKCHGDNCAIFVKVGKCIMPKEGIFCRVIKAGKVKVEDKGVFIPHALKITIITLSDRAYNDVYKDKSGPLVRNLLQPFFEKIPWHPEFELKLLPDDADELKKFLEEKIKNQTNIIITTGGTGVGPRDMTPEAILSLKPKLIPGIMDYIRVKYGEKKPNALLSRSIAAVKDKTLIYCLPGSVKAVQEYIPEITKTMEHLLYTIHNIDVHQETAM